MKSKAISRYIATFFKVFMTVLVLLIGVCIAQIIITEVENTLRYAKYRATTIQHEPGTEEKRLKRISESQKRFLPDGTIHVVHNTRYERLSGGYIEQIYPPLSRSYLVL